MATVLEVSDGGSRRFFNIFSAAPENLRDSPGSKQEDKSADIVDEVTEVVSSMYHLISDV